MNVVSSHANANHRRVSKKAAVKAAERAAADARHAAQLDRFEAQQEHERPALDALKAARTKVQKIMARLEQAEQDAHQAEAVARRTIRTGPHVGAPCVKICRCPCDIECIRVFLMPPSARLSHQTT